MKIRTILNSLGRSLVRYSEVPAPSAPPKIEPISLPEPSKQIGGMPPHVAATMAEVQRRMSGIAGRLEGMSHDEATKLVRETMADLPGVQVGWDGGAAHAHKTTEPNMSEQEYFDGLQLAPDSGTAIDTPPVLFEHIAKIRQDILRGDFPEWSLTKFATRNRHTRYACWMLGVTRGVFGVYNRSFYCCEPINDERVLSALIHLPTGTGMGLFMSNEAARSAAEIAMSLPGIEWIGSSSVDVTNISAKNDGDLIYRLRTAWQAAGIVPAPYHAHDNSDEQLHVHMQTYASTTANRPEKLS